MPLPDTYPTLAVPADAFSARNACAAELAVLLRNSRARTLALAQAFAKALGPGMVVPCAPELNPPLWELGHIGWFQAHWIARNPQRALGTRADPACTRSPVPLVFTDDLYNSSQVPHDSRWHLPLPGLDATMEALSTGLAVTLACLGQSAEDDEALYFYRLALFHEDMHAEAAVYSAQNLGLDLGPALPQFCENSHTRAAAQTNLGPAKPCLVEAGHWQLGVAPDSTPGFSFDNELAAHSVAVQAFEIDDRVVSWRRYLDYLPIDEAEAESQAWPRYLRRQRSPQGTLVWAQCRFGQWTTLDLDAPACHLSYFEVQAWCQRAGRKLPSEAQWEMAAMTHTGFQWGQVWEWTASTFGAYPGFEAHPYRDYSAPWFGTHQVLRGASSATVGRMVHPRYRNFFTPERTDIYAGFRTCAPA
jgi:ergothioneine biosynthesis protein EgtB